MKIKTVKGHEIRAGADLRRADLYEADLSGADLRRADLSGADLHRADLSGAYLYEADLSGADLRRADLSGADLHRANLFKANLIDAILHRADLSGADLHRANLRRAYLYEANLRRTNLHGAGLYDADLRLTVLDPANTPNGDVAGFCRDGELVIGYRTKKSLLIGGPGYEAGRSYRAPVFSTCDASICHPGLYLVPSIDLLGGPSVRAEIVKVWARAADVHRVGDKWRAREFVRVEAMSPREG